MNVHLDLTEGQRRAAGIVIDVHRTPVPEGGRVVVLHVQQGAKADGDQPDTEVHIAAELRKGEARALASALMGVAAEA
jgi:hypothetical protein